MLLVPEVPGSLRPNRRMQNNEREGRLKEIFYGLQHDGVAMWLI